MYFLESVPTRILISLVLCCWAIHVYYREKKCLTVCFKQLLICTNILVGSLLLVANIWILSFWNLKCIKPHWARHYFGYQENEGLWFHFFSSVEIQFTMRNCPSWRTYNLWILNFRISSFTVLWNMRTGFTTHLTLYLYQVSCDELWTNVLVMHISTSCISILPLAVRSTALRWEIIEASYAMAVALFFFGHWLLLSLSGQIFILSDLYAGLNICRWTMKLD